MRSFQDIEHLLAGLAEPSWEPGLEAYQEHLVALNEIVGKTTGGRAEGSLFYHAMIDPLDRPHPRLVGKRQNFALFAAAGETMLEVGVNVGHSLLLALAVNPRLHYVGVDLCVHPYSRRCLDYLRAHLGDRVELVEGNSRDVLPALIARRPHAFDLVHIDGGHGFDVAYADMVNALELAREGGLILFDDTNLLSLEALCDYCVISGWVDRVVLGRIWKPGTQTLLRVPQRR